MSEISPRVSAAYWIERILAAAAVLACLAVGVFVWVDISPHQPVWPLPGLYLLEMVFASFVGAYSIYRASLAGGSIWLTWAAAGLVLGFALVSAWSIGYLYLPVWAILLAAGVISMRRRKTPVLGLLTLSLAAALLQAALVMLIASLIFR